MPSQERNRTLAILRSASKGKYAILAQCCYDAQSVLATIRAAEKARSPAMVQLFPVTMKQFGIHFTRFVLDACHSASVPISVHVDHVGTDEDIARVLDWAEQGVQVDSMMIDCSHHDTDEENIAMAKPYCQRAAKLGMAVEVELGRIMGGEQGVRTMDDGALTRPEKAEQFLLELEVDMLAPSIGNIHGRYTSAPDFRLDLLDDLQGRVGPKTQANALIVLHGTDDLSDDLFRECVRRGCVKINVNSWAREPQVEHWVKRLSHDALPDVYDAGMEKFEAVCTRFFKLFGSAGKA
ncbi:aldolase [Acaromyces ingoldii]|uniref:Fructose-bisphosphate aldolase n=1 Tax=Acaromyces ingoldii TaxID=215250 RepID=A0A316YGY2_9BASI|nr:aldolase [Acaromyces ingoldii]PWN88800.1 aldolase [Acaromyces ingoldii]